MTGITVLAKTKMRLERSDDAGIELVTCHPPELGDRLVWVRGGAVAAIGDHRVVRVRDEDDAGAQRDVLPGEAQRIAGAVPVLVMVEDPRVDRGELEAVEERVAELRV